MAYKYKEEIENHIICAPVHVDDEVFDELKDVYAKSKVFDEISQVFKKVTIYNTATALEVKEILDNLEGKIT